MRVNTKASDYAQKLVIRAAHDAVSAAGLHKLYPVSEQRTRKARRSERDLLRYIARLEDAVKRERITVFADKMNGTNGLPRPWFGTA